MINGINCAGGCGARMRGGEPAGGLLGCPLCPPLGLFNFLTGRMFSGFGGLF